MKEVTLAFLGVVPETGERLMGLSVKPNGDRAVVMGIGSAEAASIAMGAGRIRAPRPLTHDLMITLFQRLNIEVRRVVIHDMNDKAFIAVLDLVTPQGVQEIDCRPSDGVALALRARAPIFVDEAVLERAGVDLRDVVGLEDDKDDDEGWID